MATRARHPFTRVNWPVVLLLTFWAIVGYAVYRALQPINDALSAVLP